MVIVIIMKTWDINRGRMRKSEAMIVKMEAMRGDNIGVDWWC